VFNTRDVFRNVYAFSGEKCASTTANTANSSVINSTTYDAEFNCTLWCTSGEMWINTDTSATTNDFKLVESTTRNKIDMKVSDFISTIADTTTAKYQYVIWDPDTDY